MSKPNERENKAYDEILTQMAGQIGSVKGLLDIFFGFMHRKTDFYIQFEKSNNDAKMGFPVGVAENMVLNSFHTFIMKDYCQEEKVIPKIEVLPDIEIQSPSLSLLSDITITTKASQRVVEPSNATDVIHALSKIQYNSIGQQIPIDNGGIATNYYWTQTLNELTVYVKATNCIKGKDVKCVMTSKSLKLTVLDELLIDGSFEESIKPDESVWTLNIADTQTRKNEECEVVITIEKIRKTWWKHVIQGDPEIDTTKVDSTQRIDEYDEATQGALRKILFDQKQKSLGLDSSEEIEKENILEKAMKLPDSPFL